MKFLLILLAVAPVLFAQPAVPAFAGLPLYPLQNSAVAVPDVNGDGIPDLVGYDNVLIAGFVDLGDGDGTFRVGPTSSELPFDGGGIATGDFNRDGKLDVLLLGEENPISFAVMLGNGDGTFTLGPTTVLPPVLAFPSGAFAVCDLNGDGILDVLSLTETQLVVMLGNGDGTFGNAQTTTLSSGSLSQDGPIAVADFNNDGKLDVATPISERYVGIWLGNGTGTFTLQSATLPEVPTYGYGLAAGDLNGDGKQDLVQVSDFEGAYAKIALGNGDGTFQKPTETALKGGQISIGDVNGDGIPDLVSDYVGIALGEGNGKFSAPTYIPSRGVYAPVLASLRNNGENDIVENTDAVLVLLNEGNGKFPGYTSEKLAASPGPILSGDFTGKGSTDVVVIESTPDIAVLVGTGKATAPFTTGPVTALSSAPGNVAAGDFNNDGIPDIATSTGGGTGGSVGVYLNNGEGTFTAETPVATTSAGYLCLGDFNGDGNLDLASSYGIVNYGNGKGGLSAPYSLKAPYSIVQCAAGDVNNDGIADIVVAFELDGSGYVYLGGKDGFSKPISLDAGNAPMILADVNNDGNLDLIQGFIGAITVQLGNGNGTFQPAITLSDPNLGIPAVLAVGDYNGDGLPDIAVSDVGNEYIVIYTGNGNGTFQDAELLAPLQPFDGYLLAADLHGQKAKRGLQDLVYTGGGALGYMINETK